MPFPGADASPDAASTPHHHNSAVVVAGVLIALLFVGVLAGIGFWLFRRRTHARFAGPARPRVVSGKGDASFAIEEDAPPPPPLSEMRKLSAPRPSLGILTAPDEMARAAALKRGPSTMTRSSGGALSPALASSVMEYAPYGAPARVLRPPSVGRPARKSRSARASKIRSMIWPNTALTDQSIAELQEELPIPPVPATPASVRASMSSTRNLPFPPEQAPPPLPQKEDKPARVVRATDLPRAHPLPTQAADLMGSYSTLPPAPGVATFSGSSNLGGRRLPALPPALRAGPSYGAPF
jgi:hypothetical protein